MNHAMASSLRRLTFGALAGMVLAILCGVLFGWLGDEIPEPDTVRFEDRLRAVVHGEAEPRVTQVMMVATAIGSVIPVVILTLVACSALWMGGMHHGSALLGAAVLGAGVLTFALKLFFHRPRPEPYFGVAIPGTFSFPSGHSLLALTFYGMLAHLAASRVDRFTLRAAIWTTAALVILLIGFSRIYLGVHYPSDVLAGYAAGVVWVLTVVFVERIFRRTRLREG